MVADSCPSCGSSSDIDLSKNVFGQLTNWDYGQGVVNVEWFFQ
jgi:expansin (peptidoglycan-binding protein)